MSRQWKVGIVKDTSKPSLGGHAMHVAFRGLPNVEVIAHVDSNTADLESKLAVTQAQRHFLTIEDMLDHEPPDIVVLFSRQPYDHLPQIETLAQAGCHIFCEKPMTADLLEADRIVQLADEKNIRIAMAHYSRHYLPFLTMKRLVDEGAIGTPLTVYGRGKDDHRGGGEDLIVLGVHVLDMEAHFFGAPEWVQADVTVGGRPIVATDRAETIEPIGPAAGDTIFASFRFPGEVRGIFESRRGMLKPEARVIHMGITVIGSEGALTLRFDDTGRNTARLRISKRPGPPEDEAAWEEVPLVEHRVIPGAEPLDFSLMGQPDVGRVYKFLESNRHNVWDLMQAIEEQRDPQCSARDARLAQEMIQGIYAASLSGSRVTFPLKDRRHPLGDT